MRQDDDFLLDDLDDEKTIEFIKNYLPQDLKDKFTDDEFYYFLDLIDEYYTQSGILDAQPDADGCIDIDLEKIVDFIIKEARKNQMGEYDPEEILFIVETSFPLLQRREKIFQARIPTDSRLVYGCFSVSFL